MCCFCTVCSYDFFKIPFCIYIICLEYYSYPFRLSVSAVAWWIRTRFGFRWPVFDLGHGLLCLGDQCPSKMTLLPRPAGSVEVQVWGILLHTSCLISKFCCLMSLHVCNKDAISYINYFVNIVFFCNFPHLFLRNICLSFALFSLLQAQLGPLHSVKCRNPLHI